MRLRRSALTLPVSGASASPASQPATLFSGMVLALACLAARAPSNAQAAAPFPASLCSASLCLESAAWHCREASSLGSTTLVRSLLPMSRDELQVTCRDRSDPHRPGESQRLGNAGWMPKCSAE